jgi:hypothetical protein
MRLLAATIGIVGALAFAHAAQAAIDPVFTFYASEAREGKANAPYPPPGTGFEGPCGVAVDSLGHFYVSDYYHDNVDVFDFARTNLAQLPKVSPLGGPCAIALDATGRLYVNDYHQAVLRYTPATFPFTSYTPYGPPTTIAQGEPTGLAVDPLSGDVYVNQRTHIDVYDSSGALVEQIGEGTLEDGYGLAFSAQPATAGYLYVPDAATNTVKVYDPGVDAINPVGEIDGSEVPGGGFTSLRDSAVAVDRLTGELYLADSLHPAGYERPESTIWVFDDDGTYRGHLKHNVVDARPVGLAVDNSATATQGYVYVTSGNTSDAFVYAYTPGAATKTPSVCAQGGPCAPAPGGEFGPGSGASGTLAAGPRLSPSPLSAASASAPTATSSELAQRGTLRVAVDGRLSPSRLPRKGTAPIAVSVSGRISTTDASPPPQLKSIRIELNRHGQLDYEGLPTCRYSQIQPASSARALAACRGALVGKGSFEANIVLSGQEPYATEGRLLVFNGEKGGKPVLYGQIYAPRPFATSFVIVFTISKIAKGTYGTALSADLPKALGSWGYVTAIQMRLARRFRHERQSHSYISAGCPAPEGFSRVSFPLARTSFRFQGAGQVSSVLSRECGVRG